MKEGTKTERFAALPFVLKLTHDQLVELAEKYITDKEEMGREGAAFDSGKRIASGERDPGLLDPIILWKSQRAKGLVAGNSDSDVRDALELATSAITDRAAVAVLCGLRGVLVPVASAILTAVFPNRFTVIDYRALESLGVELDTPTIDQYLQYLNFCRAKATDTSLSLRDLDRALWRASKDALK